MGSKGRFANHYKAFCFFEGPGYDFSLFVNPGRLLPKQ
jgi:hypothetical protein